MNIAESLERAARHFANQPAIVFEGETLTYARLQAAVDRSARGLAGLGVAAGDRVALHLPNIPAFAVAYFAAQKIGAVAVSVNTMLTTEEIHYVLADSGAHTVFTTADLLPAVRPLIGVDVEPGRLIVCEGDAAGHLALDRLGTDGHWPARDLDPTAAAAILYTSGTTGRQKGATLCHGNVVSNAYAVRHAMRVEPNDRLLLFLPLFHCFGQNFILNTVINSGAAVVLHRRFVPAEIVASIEANGVTMFFGVPTVFIGLLNAGVAPEAMVSVRYYFSAAATMPVEVAERWRATFGAPIHEGYGLTETSPFAYYDHEWSYRPGSVGTPIENVEVRVVDSEDRPLPTGTWGEIVIRGPNVMLGYWNRPEKTAGAKRGGWFHTGDVGHLDDDGYLFLVDRVKDMINVGGFKVWPREVEEVLYRHTAVKECAVVGISDPVKGEVARAFVVLGPEADRVDAAELAAYCREHLATYKVPSAFEFVAELPKSATGKILKRVLRERAGAR